MEKKLFYKKGNIVWDFIYEWFVKDSYIGSSVKIRHRNATVMSKSYKSGLSLQYCASTLGFRAARVFCDWVVPCVGCGLFFYKKNRTLPSHLRAPGYSQYGRGGERQVQTRDLYGTETVVLRRNYKK